MTKRVRAWQVAKARVMLVIGRVTAHNYLSNALYRSVNCSLDEITRSRWATWRPWVLVVGLEAGVEWNQHLWDFLQDFLNLISGRSHATLAST